MKLTRDDAFELYNGIETVLKSDIEYDFKFNYALIKTKKELKPEVEEIVDMLNIISKKQKAINIEFCSKDKDGKPVINDGSYTGLEAGMCQEFDTASEVLAEERKTYVREEIEIKEYKIPADSVPKKLKGKFQETIIDLIEE